MWAGAVVGGAVAAWTFLLEAGCLRIWFAVLQPGRRTAGGPLLMMTAVATGALATVPRLLFTSWMLVFPGYDFRRLGAVVWEPWTMAQDLLWSLRAPAAWSVLLGLTAIVVWLLLSLALVVAARADAAFESLADRFARLTAWSVAAVWLQYLVLCLVLECWLTPTYLGGAWRLWQ
jgi:hypothetical protein